MAGPTPAFNSLEIRESYSVKLAGKESFFAAIALPLLGFAALQALSSNTKKHMNDAGLEKEEKRDIQQLLNEGDVDALWGANNELRRTDDKLAAVAVIAERCGRTLAKEAGIGGIISSAGNIAATAGKGLLGAGKSAVGALTPGLKSKALAVGGAAALGYGALKGGKALYNAGMEPAHEKVYGAGPALPRYVNQYGVPT